MPELPKRLLVVGGGITGVEFAWAFAALGSEVTIVQRRTLLPRIDSVVSLAFETWLRSQRRITLRTRDAAVSVSVLPGGNGAEVRTVSGAHLQADYALLALGRRPDLTFADATVLASLSTPSAASETSTSPSVAPAAAAAAPAPLAHHAHSMETCLPGIYVAGDLAGAPMTANRSMMQARQAVKHMLKKLPEALTASVSSLSLSAHSHHDHPAQPFIEIAWTCPPVGQVGEMAPLVGDGSRFEEREYGGLLRARLEEQTEGLLRVHVERASGLILGAAAFGHQADALLGLIQLALQHRLTWAALHAWPLAHPSFTELLTSL